MQCVGLKLCACCEHPSVIPKLPVLSDIVGTLEDMRASPGISSLKETSLASLCNQCYIPCSRDMGVGLEKWLHLSFATGSDLSAMRTLKDCLCFSCSLMQLFPPVNISIGDQFGCCI